MAMAEMNSLVVVLAEEVKAEVTALVKTASGYLKWVGWLQWL